MRILFDPILNKLRKAHYGDTYLNGNESVEGSLRIVQSPSNPKAARIEERSVGSWDLGSLEVASASVTVGGQITISDTGGGRLSYSINKDEDARNVLTRTVFDKFFGTTERPLFEETSPIKIRNVFVPIDTDEKGGNLIGFNFTTTGNVYTHTVYMKIGNTVPDKAVFVDVYEAANNSDSKKRVVCAKLDPGQWAPNSEIIFNLPEELSTPPNTLYWIQVSSESLFSLKGFQANPNDFFPWWATDLNDVYPVELVPQSYPYHRPVKYINDSSLNVSREYYATDRDDVLLIDASGGSLSIIIPESENINGRVFNFNDLGTVLGSNPIFIKDYLLNDITSLALPNTIKGIIYSSELDQWLIYEQLA